MKDKLTLLAAKRELLKQRLAEDSAALADLEEQHRDAREAQAVIQRVAEAVQQSAHGRVAAIVSRCLKAVFGAGAYEFRIDFAKKRGKTEAEFLLVRGGASIDPLEAAGGGVCDVVSLALRVAALVLTRPQRRQLLVLDEPARHLSAGYRRRLAPLLEELSSELGVQMILVSHWAEFEVGNVVELPL